MKTMLRLNKIKNTASFEGTTACVKVKVEEHENTRENQSENTERIDEFLGYMNDTQGSCCWPQFKFTFKSRTRELAQNFGENIVDAMENLDLFRIVKVGSLSEADKNNNYTVTINCGMQY